MNQPWVYMCSPSWTPLPHLSPSHPSGSSVLSTLSHASNLDWRSTSHMIINTFQCYPLKSSHPHLLPQSPKDCSLHLYLFCCLAYRVIVTIFLNSICMCYYTVLVFFFLTYFTLYNRHIRGLLLNKFWGQTTALWLPSLFTSAGFHLGAY